MIDVYLNFHEDAEWYFTPREAVYKPKQTGKNSGTEGYVEILKTYKQGHPSFEFIKYDGKRHYVGYATC